LLRERAELTKIFRSVIGSMAGWLVSYFLSWAWALWFLIALIWFIITKKENPPGRRAKNPVQSIRSGPQYDGALHRH